MQPDFQKRVRDWTKECFGDRIDLHHKTRQVQLLEEVIELLQSVNLSKEIVTQIVDLVYSKEKGDAFFEAGDVMISFAAFCTAHGLSMSECGEIVLKNCIEKTEAIRKKQNHKPFHRKHTDEI